MNRPQPSGSFYLLITIAMSLTVFTGFSFTYFGPLFGGEYPEVSPMVHAHGWTFFAWYLLLPLQAGLVRTGNVRIHRTLGLGTIVLGAAMILVGIVVTLVQIDRALGPEGDPFWQLMGLPIFGIWVLFTVFYTEAIRRRRRIDEHKRLIVLASAVALSAASARILFQIWGFRPWVAAVGCLACLVFPLVAMIHDRRTRHESHPVYLWGVPAAALVIGGAFLLDGTPGGELMERGLGWAGRIAEWVY